MEAFSDAIISIAATLLCIDLRPPRVANLANESLIHALESLWPSYLAFAVSFIFIGIAWAAHHDMFRYIWRTNHVLLMLNLLFLMSIVVQPFSTALLAEHLGNPGERPTALVYYGVLLTTSFSYNLIWHYAVRHKLIHNQTDLRLLKALHREYAVAPLLHATAFIVALWNVPLSIVPVMLSYAFFALPRVTERFDARNVIKSASPVRVDHGKGRILLLEMEKHRREHRVLQDVGKIPGMIGVTVVHRRAAINDAAGSVYQSRRI